MVGLQTSEMWSMVVQSLRRLLCVPRRMTACKQKNIWQVQRPLVEHKMSRVPIVTLIKYLSGEVRTVT